MENCVSSSRKKPGNKKYRCRECMKLLSSKQSLREHKYSHSQTKPYTCQVCNKSFRHGSQFTLHKQSHQKEANLSWPKLTDMLKNAKNNDKELLLIYEKIKIPMIGRSQIFNLPDIRGYLEI